MWRVYARTCVHAWVGENVGGCGYDSYFPPRGDKVTGSISKSYERVCVCVFVRMHVSTFVYWFLKSALQV